MAYNQKQLDFFFQQPAEVAAPPPDLFELEVDSLNLDISLAAIDAELRCLPSDSTDIFAFLRSETPTCGPPSTITVSSESASAYESLSTDSYYNYTPTNYSYPLDMEFQQRVRLGDYGVSPHKTATALSVDAVNDRTYGASISPNGSISLDDFDPVPFGTLPTRGSASVYSDKGSDYFPPVPNHPSLAYATVAPSSLSPQSHSTPSPDSTGHPLPYISSPVRTFEAPHNEDPRKKYQCNQCTRAFARAYNLKTHQATHDPNRPKPHVCPHRSCSRSFSRKHDLGRHLVSIHRDEPSPKVGVAALKEARKWCDRCGKSFTKEKTCDCVDVK